MLLRKDQPETRRPAARPPPLRPPPRLAAAALDACRRTPRAAAPCTMQQLTSCSLGITSRMYYTYAQQTPCATEMVRIPLLSRHSRFTWYRSEYRYRYRPGTAYLTTLPGRGGRRPSRARGRRRTLVLGEAPAPRTQRETEARSPKPKERSAVWRGSRAALSGVA